MSMGKKITRVLRESMAVKDANGAIAQERDAFWLMYRREHRRLARMTVLAAVALAGWAVAAWMLWKGG